MTCFLYKRRHLCILIRHWTHYKFWPLTQQHRVHVFDIFFLFLCFVFTYFLFCTQISSKILEKEITIVVCLHYSPFLKIGAAWTMISFDWLNIVQHELSSAHMWAELTFCVSQNLTSRIRLLIKQPLVANITWATVTSKPVFRIFDQVRLKPACAAIEAS